MVDLEGMARQFSGRRVAELVLHHVNEQDLYQCRAALLGLRAELREELAAPVLDLVDFFVAMPQPEQKQFFSADLGFKFPEIVDVTKGFLEKRHGVLITPDEAFTIFNLLILNWALACHANAETKAAMKKAAGIGFLGRLFGS
ncbi:hypothetical protein [Mesorhizobium sp. M1322]|uniref:hypothetical protein n=1 Tax=Mesorhizobium sp. M1322 TaxID=2957081 RepID=UPI003334BCF6